MGQEAEVRVAEAQAAVDRDPVAATVLGMEVEMGREADQVLVPAAATEVAEGVTAPGVTSRREANRGLNRPTGPGVDTTPEKFQPSEAAEWQRMWQGVRVEMELRSRER